MGRVLVFCETNSGAPKKGCLELLTAAKKAQAEISAVILGPHAEQAAAEVRKYGVGVVYICKDDHFKEYNPESFTDILYTIVKEAKAEILLASASALGRDLFPRLAGRLKTGVASDCTELAITGDKVTARKPLLSGRCSAEVAFQESPVKIVLMRPNQLPVGNPESSPSGTIKEISYSPKDLRTTIVEVTRGTSQKLDLTEANIIVAGGRGLKGPEHFKLLEELADVLGATVGASRAVVDAGWVSHTMQVGQTGKTVAPSLYIACGVSGAIQHLAGMSASKVIVAINTDPDAPIFQKATYGIVGDVFEVLPLMIKEFKQLLSH